MIDYNELKDGNEFELLMRDLLQRYFFDVRWSGRGQDGGKDIVLYEMLVGILGEYKKKWVIQCKNFAKSNKSVGIDDLNDISGVCEANNSDGYFLACTTFMSSNAIEKCKEICKNKNLFFIYWDSKKIENELLKPSNWDLLIQYFPKFADSSKIQISIIEPNFWCARYKESIVYLSSRISGNPNYTINDVTEIIDRIDLIFMKEQFKVKCRAMYFDDKNCNINLYIDVIIFDKTSKLNKEYITNKIFKNICVDFCLYVCDIKFYNCDERSDHYDINHYEFYNDYINIFKYGIDRPKIESNNLLLCIDCFSNEFIDSSFNKLRNVLTKLKWIKILHCNNSRIENIDKINFITGYSEIELNINNFDNLFYPYFTIEVFNIKEFEKLLSILPIRVGEYIEVSKHYRVCPGDDIDFAQNEDIYTIEIKVICSSNKSIFRKKINKYMNEISNALNNYVSKI